jgi:hypothetical protein
MENLINLPIDLKVNNQKQYTKILSLDVVCINTIRCKNTKTARIKLPSEGKNQSKWVSRKRA